MSKLVDKFVDELLEAESKKARGADYLPNVSTKSDYSDQKCSCPNEGWHEKGKCQNYAVKGKTTCSTCAWGKI